MVGVGINCRQAEADFDPSIRDMACSAAMILGRDPDRNRLIAAMIRALHRMSGKLLTGRDEMLDSYRRDCVTLGREISVLRGDAVFHATALTVDAEGGLVIRLTDGTEQTVTSGEVSIRGFYGYI